ncbi:hypothetical protein [Chryseobacterium gregarium]|uniref:hypothetical protein n=1 Tax=Chryseobacterium gregarium TaxID=456299 RepID=UPI000481E6FE|nr:hypothetical protein [Chryseobacterium gregarium]
MDNFTVKKRLFNNINRSIIIGSVFFIISCEKKVDKFNENPKVNAETSSFEKPTEKNLKENTLLFYLKKAKTVKPDSKNGIPFSKLDFDKL